MKILLLTQVLPHPPDSGPKVKTAALLASLAERHEVILVSFTRGDQGADLNHLRRFCRDVHGVPLRRGLLRDAWHLGRSLLSGRSFLLARDERAELRALVRRLAAETRFDVVHADQLNMAPYAVEAPGAARVLDAHNAMWSVAERLARTMPRGPRRFLLEREARLLKAYEGRVCREFDGVLAVSEEDRAALVEAAGVAVPIAVMPIAIDVAAVAPVDRDPGASRLVHIGSLIWPPTADGLEWFLREVWPRLRARRPGVCLDVIGANPPASIVARTGRDSGVRLHGHVADPAPLLREAAVMVVPLRAGGGMRVRILNGLAQRMPMVTTSIGREGIDVQHGRELLIADEPEAFAAAVIELLEDPEKGVALGAAARGLAETRYDARTVCRAVDEVYATAVTRRGGR